MHILPAVPKNPSRPSCRALFIPLTSSFYQKSPDIKKSHYKTLQLQKELVSVSVTGHDALCKQELNFFGKWPSNA